MICLKRSLLLIVSLAINVKPQIVDVLAVPSQLELVIRLHIAPRSIGREIKLRSDGGGTRR